MGHIGQVRSDQVRSGQVRSGKGKLGRLTCLMDKHSGPSPDKERNEMKVSPDSTATVEILLNPLKSCQFLKTAVLTLEMEILTITMAKLCS